MLLVSQLVLLIFATRAFSLLTRGFELITCGFELVTRELELATGGFELVTRGFELVTRQLELVTRGFDLVTRNLCFTFPLLTWLTNNYNTYIKQYLTKWKQPYNEIWSGNIKCDGNIFLQKTRLASDFFLFFEKAVYEVKASSVQLSFKSFNIFR